MLLPAPLSKLLCNSVTEVVLFESSEKWHWWVINFEPSEFTTYWHCHLSNKFYLEKPLDEEQYKKNTLYGKSRKCCAPDRTARLSWESSEQVLHVLTSQLPGRSAPGCGPQHEWWGVSSLKVGGYVNGFSLACNPRVCISPTRTMSVRLWNRMQNRQKFWTKCVFFILLLI